MPAVVGKRNPTTLRMEWQVDPAGRVGVRFFVRGYPYRVLGLFPASRHLLGTADDERPRTASTSWGPTAWAATSGRG